MKLALLMTAVVAITAMWMGQDANAAESQRGDVPTALLVDLGLGGMQTISDAEGNQVRGAFLGNSVVDYTLRGPKVGPTLLLPNAGFAFPAFRAEGGLRTADLAPPTN